MNSADLLASKTSNLTLHSLLDMLAGTSYFPSALRPLPYNKSPVTFLISRQNLLQLTFRDTRFRYTDFPSNEGIVILKLHRQDPFS